MSREIEMKVPLSEERFAEIESVLLGKKRLPEISFRSPERIFKSDEYFSFYRTHEERLRNKELPVIRIRTEKKSPAAPDGGVEDNPRSFFCIKEKRVEGGLELNSESETYIENPDVLRAFFAAAGYAKWFEKTKKSLSVFCSPHDNPGFEAHLELVRANNLPYAEIEYTGDDFSSDEVRASLVRILGALGVDSGKSDSRSWAEILGS